MSDCVSECMRARHGCSSRRRATRASGWWVRWRRTRGSGRRPPCSSSAVHAQATAWEHERRTRVNARRAELETLLGTVGTEITLKVADVALKDDADQSLHPRMRTRLSRGRGRPLNVRVRRLHSSERIDRPRSASCRRGCVVRLQRHRPPPRGGALRPMRPRRAAERDWTARSSGLRHSARL